MSLLFGHWTLSMSKKFEFASHDAAITDIKEMFLRREDLGFFHEEDHTHTVLIKHACDKGLGDCWKQETEEN